VLRCVCGEEAICGSLWTAEHAAAWHREHGGCLADFRGRVACRNSGEARALTEALTAAGRRWGWTGNDVVYVGA